MVPFYRQALNAWGRRDDSVLQATEVAEVLESRHQEAAGLAELGCREAAAAVAERDDERIRFVIMETATTSVAEAATSRTSRGRDHCRSSAERRPRRRR